MYYYRASIQYDGTGYAGFQWQSEGQTIQRDLNEAIAQLVTGNFTTAGASRTDSGVHALDQVMRIASENPLELDTFLVNFNRRLPAQIRCLGIAPCPAEFRPSFDTTSKEYRYLFTNTTEFNESERRFISNIANKLDVPLIHECLKKIIGEHDFCNFVSSGSNVKSTVRTITLCELTEVNPHTLFPRTDLFPMPPGLTNCYQLKIEASGFLKQMIRHLMSALWMVGSGKLPVEQFVVLLDGPKRAKRLWRPAPARGLYLARIQY